MRGLLDYWALSVSMETRLFLPAAASVTDDENFAKKAKHLTTQAKCDPFEYIHDEIGYNYPVSQYSCSRWRCANGAIAFIFDQKKGDRSSISVFAGKSS